MGIENKDDPIEVCVTYGDCKRVNFGNYQPPLEQKNGSISGYKYEDVNLNKVIDGGDTIVLAPDWTVNLYYYDQTSSKYVYMAQTTTVNGFYQFTGLDITLKYKVEEVQQSGWIAVISENVDLVIPGPYGDQHNKTDFLNARLGCVEGTKWQDWNLDRKIGSGDGPVSGWGVDLYIWDDIEEEWVLIAATSTDANGKYCFCNLDPYKAYKVAEHGKSGWVQVPPTSYEGIEIPESGGKAGGNDFLNARLGCVEGTKWEDWNLDRKIGSGDGPVSGWGVDLYIWDDTGRMGPDRSHLHRR